MFIRVTCLYMSIHFSTVFAIGCCVWLHTASLYQNYLSLIDLYLARSEFHWFKGSVDQSARGTMSVEMMKQIDGLPSHAQELLMA